MNKLLQHRYLIRQNLITLIGVCLCFYFVYHIVQGDRSVVRLLTLGSSVESMSQKNDILQRERLLLEQKVSMMRPENINRDLLEERVRVVLGYNLGDELVVVSN
jgi:cell division protein FtsB